MGRSDYNSGLRSSARSALHNNNSETSTGSRGAWGRPLSAACHTDNTTGSGGALGLNSLTLESNTNEGNSNGNSMNDMDNSDNGDVTVNPPDVAQAIQTRLTQYKKQKKSILTKMMRSQQNVVLNFSRLGVVTLDEETVSEMIRGKVEKLTLSENKDTLLIVPEPLVRGLDGGQQPLSTLQHLDLSQCHLSLLGAQQEWNLPNLTHLDLSKNRLRDFPSASVLSGLPMLKTLDLYGNRIMSLPDFGAPSALSGASSHDISPSSSGEFDLEISVHGKGNHIEPTTDSVVATRRPSFQATKPNKNKRWGEAACLLQLVELNVGYNDLTYLPESLPPQLKTLNACNNFFSTVPEEMVMSSLELKELDITSNPLQYPPPEICESGLRIMRKWFQEHGSAATASVNSGSNRSVGSANRLRSSTAASDNKKNSTIRRPSSSQRRPSETSPALTASFKQKKSGALSKQKSRSESRQAASSPQPSAAEVGKMIESQLSGQW